MLADPLAEAHRRLQLREQEHRHARHPLAQHRRRDAPAERDGFGPACYGSNERSFGRRERGIQEPSSLSSVEEQRASDPDRHFHGADHVLDVLGQFFWNERCALERAERRTGLLPKKLESMETRGFSIVAAKWDLGEGGYALRPERVDRADDGRFFVPARRFEG